MNQVLEKEFASWADDHITDISWELCKLQPQNFPASQSS